MSSEKQYNDIEKRIIEAANGSDYPFEESSWRKMEQLLDHRKDRRRPFFWIFGALLLGALITGAVYTFTNNNQQKDQPIAGTPGGDKNNIISYEDRSQTPVSKNTDAIPNDKPTLPATNTVTYSTNGNPVASIGSPVGNSVAGNTENDKDKPAKVNSYKTSSSTSVLTGNTTAFKNTRRAKKSAGKKNTAAENNTGTENLAAANKNLFKTNSEVKMKITAPELEADADVIVKDGVEKVEEDVKVDKVEKIDKVVKKDSTKPETKLAKATAPKKDKKKKENGLYVLAGLGAETNSTKLFSFKNSTITPRYGIAAGYQFNKRFSVQAGFFAGAKKYIAGPGDYTIKAGSYLSTVKIIEVDANCLVYEVPVTLQYNWLIKPTANYYASLGIASYLMKKEKYNYTYERYNTIYHYPYNYTKNSHLFAAVQVSVGVEKKLGKHFYLQAAPAVSIPLNGVGEGKVKIFTASVQVGLKYFPFKK